MAPKLPPKLKSSWSHGKAAWAAVATVIAAIAAMLTNLGDIRTSVRQLLFDGPADITIRDARNVLAWDISERFAKDERMKPILERFDINPPFWEIENNAPRSTYAVRIVMEVVIANSGEGRAPNCLGELMLGNFDPIQGIVYDPNGVLGDVVVDVEPHSQVRVRYEFTMRSDQFRENGKVGVTCGPSIAPSIDIAFNNLDSIELTYMIRDQVEQVLELLPFSIPFP